MAKSRTYLVSFSPAQRTDHGFTTQMSLMIGGQQHTIEASSFDQLEAEVRRLAVAFGQSCSPYVRLAKRGERNAPGFDAWCNKVRFIEFIPAEANAA